MKKFWSSFVQAPEPGFETTYPTERVFRGFCFFWFVWWSVLPFVALGNDYIDILENIVWGRHFQFGYDKNPYLGAWIVNAFYELTCGGVWINYVLSQVFVIAGFWAVWRLALRMVSAPAALVAVLALAAINFYGIKATELCDDVMELGLWPLAIYFFYLALTENHRWRDWLLTGLFAGLALMTKYYAVVLFLPMLLVLVTTAKGLAAWRRVPFYAAGVLALAISLPNLWWLVGNDMVAVDYALTRASLTDGVSFNWVDHVYQPWRAFNRALGVAGIPLIFLALLLFPRDRIPRTGDTIDRFNRIFLIWFVAGPFGVTLLFALVTGGSINYSWVVPCFPLLPLLTVFLMRPRLNPLRIRLFVGAMVTMGIVFDVIFVVRSVYQQPYLKRGCDYENYPGRELAQRVTEAWHEQQTGRLPFVIGNREAACNVAVYSPDRPEAYFSADLRFSQWIDEADIRRDGAVLLWMGKAENKPKFLTRFTAPDYRMSNVVTVKLSRTTPAWFRRLIGREPKLYTASYCFLLPETAAAK
ncbi:MAG: glycosyltransferase family 39 protein [Victivallales bacterium]|nr:glycosyltransferase family 39 protein [Victivallales bacterium]